MPGLTLCRCRSVRLLSSPAKLLFFLVPVFQVKHFLGPDIIAGLTVGVMAIPQAMSYALVSGISPQYGLYSAYIGMLPCTSVLVGEG